MSAYLRATHRLSPAAPGHTRASAPHPPERAIENKADTTRDQTVNPASICPSTLYKTHDPLPQGAVPKEIPVTLNCYFQFENGRFCKKFAMNGSRFCNNHQPPDAPAAPAAGPARSAPRLHPHVRLSDPTDLFDLVRETLYAARTGAVNPSQAFAISSLGALWLRVYEKSASFRRLQALEEQVRQSLFSDETPAAAELAAIASHLVSHPSSQETEASAADPEPQAGSADQAEPGSDDLAPLYPEADEGSRRVDPHNPWAAGQMAGSVSPEAAAGSGRVSQNSAKPDLAQAQAKLAALLASQAKAGSPPAKPNGPHRQDSSPRGSPDGAPMKPR